MVSRGFGTTDEGSVEIAADYKGFLDTLASSPKAVVYYTATWCPPVSNNVMIIFGIGVA